MQQSQYTPRNIFCIEGVWNNDLKDKTSIRSALDFIEHNGAVKHIHKNCSTPDQLEEWLKEAVLKRYKQYGIIYLAFHGHPGTLQVGKRKKMTLGEIAEVLQDKAEDKIIHFGSCSTLAISKWEINRFIKKTGALAVSGYSCDIDFMPSTFLDILYFQFCQRYSDMPLIHKDVKTFYGPMARQLGFKMVYPRAHPRPHPQPLKERTGVPATL